MSDDLAESWPSLFCSVFEETKPFQQKKKPFCSSNAERLNFCFCLRNLYSYFCTWYSHNWVTHNNKPSWYFQIVLILTIVIKKNEVGCCYLLDMSVCCTSHKCMCNMNKYWSQNVNSSKIQNRIILLHLIDFKNCSKIKLNL